MFCAIAEFAICHRKFGINGRLHCQMLLPVMFRVGCCLIIRQYLCVQVVHTVTLEGISELEMLQLAACLERCSNHPLAAVIVGHAAAQHLQLDAAVSDSQVLPGEFGMCCLAFKQQHANGYHVHHIVSYSCCAWQLLLGRACRVRAYRHCGRPSDGSGQQPADGSGV